MKSVRNISDSSRFPFSLLFKDTKNAQNERSNHMHDYHEMVYIHSGKGTFMIDNEPYEIRRGDLFIIPEKIYHYALPEKGNSTTSSAIFFSPKIIHNLTLSGGYTYLQLFETCQLKQSYKIALTENQRTEIEEHIRNIRHEAIEGLTDSQHAILLILHKILLDLNRIKFLQKNLASSIQLGPIWMQDILEYIDEHINNELSLTLLAGEALVSPSHFSRAFKHTTGMGLAEYLNIKRIIKAKELLMETEYSIAYIAELSCFDSIANFHRIFKKYTGVTPSLFRKR